MSQTDRLDQSFQEPAVVGQPTQSLRRIRVEGCVLGWPTTCHKAKRRTTRNGLQDGSSPFHPPNDATAMRRVSRVVLVGRDPSAVDAA